MGGSNDWPSADRPLADHGAPQFLIFARYGRAWAVSFIRRGIGGDRLAAMDGDRFWGGRGSPCAGEQYSPVSRRHPEYGAYDLYSCPCRVVCRVGVERLLFCDECLWVVVLA